MLPKVLPTSPLVAPRAVRFINSSAVLAVVAAGLSGSRAKLSGLHAPGVEKLLKYPSSLPATSLFTAKIATSQQDLVFKTDIPDF